MAEWDIAARLARVRARIGEAALRAGRQPDDVRLVAVSKTFPIEAVREAYLAGQRDFAENKVQEALQKIAAGADMQIGWHLVGHLQSNKARKAAAHVGWVHSVDSADLLKRLDTSAAEARRSVNVLIQVDLALEATKHGATIDEVPAIVRSASVEGAARLVGLMLLPPLVDDLERARTWFRRLRELRDRLVDEGARLEQLRELSMGMSHDFEVAIEEGATMVRVGSAIFGERAAHP